MGVKFFIRFVVGFSICLIVSSNSENLKSHFEQGVENFMKELNGKEVKAIDNISPEVDHHSHDHMNHNEHQGHMMKMWFHGGYEEVILFDFWRTDGLFSLLLSCLAIFIMGATYEGVKWFRVFLQLNQPIHTYIQNKSCVEIPLTSTHCSPNHQTISRNNSNSNSKILIQQSEPFITTISAKRASPLSAQRLIQGFLYILQLVLAYWLMLITMTYNIYLTASVVLGAGFGHWLFAVLQLRTNDSETSESFEADACH